MNNFLIRLFWPFKAYNECILQLGKMKQDIADIKKYYQDTDKHVRSTAKMNGERALMRANGEKNLLITRDDIRYTG
uniref:Uncharacterized protein n=1 Tax=viral metagenome TaxID=1070528 RepID=A0A6M3KYM4_9ZZZZ